MKITKKIDRAFQWAGEKMGQEAKTTMSDDFKMLETEMALRQDGMERMHKTMNSYVKSLSRRGEGDDKEKGLAVSNLGRTMIAHGEDFEADSEFGNCLVSMGRGQERVAGFQDKYISCATSYWLESLERSLAMMKEYQSARKKLENRRLTYDANMTKIQKAKKEDYRLEDDLRTAKAKYEESQEDVLRRMQDIKEAEAESIQDLTNFLDAELDYYESCAEELRRVRREWPGAQSPPSRHGTDRSLSRRPTGRSRSNSNTATYSNSYSDRNERWADRQDIYEEPEPTPVRMNMPIRSNRIGGNSTPPSPPRRPAISRSSTYGSSFEGPRSRQSSYREPPPPPPPQVDRDLLRPTTTVPSNVGTLRANLRPVSRISTGHGSDVFADDTSSGSPEYDRSESPATSYGSLSRTTSYSGLNAGAGVMKKAPPPPPPSRSKKPPPPIPRKSDYGY